jgi:hypothetical protein
MRMLIARTLNDTTRRALSDGTRNLWGKMWDANPTFVTAQCQGMFKPVREDYGVIQGDARDLIPHLCSV